KERRALPLADTLVARGPVPTRRSLPNMPERVAHGVNENFEPSVGVEGDSGIVFSLPAERTPACPRSTSGRRLCCVPDRVVSAEGEDFQTPVFVDAGDGVAHDIAPQIRPCRPLRGPRGGLHKVPDAIVGIAREDFHSSVGVSRRRRTSGDCAAEIDPRSAPGRLGASGCQGENTRNHRGYRTKTTHREVILTMTRVRGQRCRVPVDTPPEKRRTARNSPFGKRGSDVCCSTALI